MEKLIESVLTKAERTLVLDTDKDEEIPTVAQVGLVAATRLLENPPWEDKFDVSKLETDETTDVIDLVAGLDESDALSHTFHMGAKITTYDIGKIAQEYLTKKGSPIAEHLDEVAQAFKVARVTAKVASLEKGELTYANSDAISTNVVVQTTLSDIALGDTVVTIARDNKPEVDLTLASIVLSARRRVAVIDGN